MKPPPRQRTKTHPSAKPASKPQRLSQWSWFEQRRLLRSLGNLDQDQELDYSSLAKSVRSRSCSEVTAAVESLKDRVIAFASSELKKTLLEEKSHRKPIEMWTSLASTVAGANQEPISKAFAQVFLVSSIEPRTLANSELPHSHRPSESQPARTAPPTPLPRSAVRVPKRKVLLQQPSSGGESVTPTSSSVAAAAASAPSTAAALAPSAAAATALSPPAAAFAAAAPAPSAAAATAAADGQRAPTDAPPTTSTEASSSVDFEKIYNFLCGIQKPNKQIELTPMEAAILVDLLMSLPEELPHLNCKKLREHLNKVFHFLTSPADCNDPTELFRSLREVASGQQGEAASCPQTDGKDKQAAEVANSTERSMQPGGAGSQSAASCSGQSGGTAVIYPPLNPFLVPLELLARK